MQRLQRAEQLIGKYVKNQEQYKHLNAFISKPAPARASELLSSTTHNGTLSGSYIAIKDNICTSDLRTTCASKGLETFTSPYDATVVSRIRDAGGLIAGKTNLDEFGMGSHSTHSIFNPVRTPSGRSAGGSSGGSAVAVATQQCDTAIGTDTGGSVRLPAAYNDIFGFKPSYGLVSRWGVVAYANSLDTVGFLGRDVSSMRALFEQCNAYDPNDPTSLSQATRKRMADTITSVPRRPGQLRIGVPKEYNIASLSDSVRTVWSTTLRSLQAAGHTIQPVSLPSTRSALSAYYVLAPAEASSNLAKYDSVRYGTRPPAAPSTALGVDAQQHEASGSGGELFARTRYHGFGREVRRRILLGSYSLSAAAMDNYFVQAQRVRRGVQRDFDRVFALGNLLRDPSATEHKGNPGVDVLIVPTAPGLPPLLEDVEKLGPLEAYASDVFTVPASLAGLPAASAPVRLDRAEDGIASVGMQVIGQFGDDALVLDVAAAMEGLGLCVRHSE